MEKDSALIYLGKIQLDLINRKKAVASERAKLEDRLSRIASTTRSYGKKLSYNDYRDRNFLVDRIRYLKNEEDNVQSKIDAIIFARQFLKEH